MRSFVFIQFAAAVSSFEAAIAVQPDHLDAHKGLLEVYKRTDDAVASIPVLTRLIDIVSVSGYV